MTSLLRHLGLSLGLLFLLLGQAGAKDITLAWDKNPEPDVAGYKVYYKAESSAAPLDGWGANEGDSPIVVGDLTTAKITGLMTSQTYYFAVSAYDTAGYESELSNIVASAAVPLLTYPTPDAVAVNRPVTFTWEYAPFAAGMSYTLLVGTKPGLPLTGNQANALPSDDSRSPSALAGLVGLGLLGGGLTARRSRWLALLLWTATCLSLAACGGGGGGGGGGDPDSLGATQSPNNPGSAGTSGGATLAGTLVLSQLTTPFATVAELQPGTTYYWQVVAVDAQGFRYESLVQSFTTAQ